MLRRLFNALLRFSVVLSLLLAIFGTAIWIRSHFRQDVAYVGIGGRVFEVAWLNGTFRFNIADHHRQFDIRHDGIAGIPTLFGETLVEIPASPPGFNGKTGWNSWPVADNTWHWYVQPSSEYLFSRWNLQWQRGIRNQPGTDSSTPFHPFHQFWCRCWHLAAAGLVLPFFASLTMIRKRWRARRLPGHFKVCNYDLRASKDRCPECGTAIPALSGSTP
jgi:hypothetical protein